MRRFLFLGLQTQTKKEFFVFLLALLDLQCGVQASLVVVRRLT